MDHNDNNHNDNNNAYTREYKLEAIGLTKFARFLPEIAIDEIFKETIKNGNVDINDNNAILLHLVNKLFSAVKKSEITDVNKFKMDSSDIKKIDGVRFVDDNINLLNKIGLTYESLQYENRYKRKKYILIVLKAIFLKFDYDFVSFRTSRNKASVTKYKVVKIAKT